MKRILFGLALLITALGAGLLALVADDAPPASAPRLVAEDNPGVAGAPAPGAAWGRDALKAPAKIVAPPVKPALPERVVVLANQRDLPAPPPDVEAPRFGPP